MPRNTADIAKQLIRHDAPMKIARQKTTKTQGAPAGNSNSVRHGLRANKLPARLAWADRRVNSFRKVVEQAVIDAKGEVSLVDAATIQTCLRFEKHAILAGHWLAKEIDNLSPDQRLAHSREVAKASAERDKCLRSLGIDTPPDVPELADYLDGTVKDAK